MNSSEFTIAQWNHSGTKLSSFEGLYSIQYTVGYNKPSFYSNGMPGNELKVYETDDLLSGSNLEYISPARLTIIFDKE
jgi:hypothetical protein